MAREIKEFTTPGGHKVVLKTYFTGAESNAINAIAFADSKIDTSQAVDGKVAMNEMSASTIIPQQELMMKFIVVSIDGDPKADVGQLPEAEYNAILLEVQKIRVPLVPAK
jgi:hypothetical protein